MGYTIEKAFRVFQVLRPLRIINKTDNLRVAISALLKTVPDMLPVLFVTIIFYIILSITGHYLLFMKMRDCVVDRTNEDGSLYSDAMLQI